ncbi:tyrosine decarboxylase 1-like [Gossypium australe]|uniref:Tyrosine decarboxylase 1-like n=1 Tax=Gossypium australe TaxID=47621 RepID=A0A5B6VMN4_9ROSI|nr:tyrosine decarboxylase 1-like [Gossypium australe]
MTELPSSSFLKLDRIDVLLFGKATSREEIKTTLFDMVPLKTLGSDGLNAHFFQKKWDLIGGAFCEWVQKVIANQFKVVFPKIIEKEPASFIAGRNIVDKSLFPNK